MKSVGTKRLETNRLILRRFEVKDAKAMFETWANDEEVTKYLTWPVHGNVDVTESLLREWVSNYKNEKYFHWVIEVKETNRIIGSIGVVGMREDIDLAHIGYCIAKDYWNKGYTSEAYKEVIRFLFEEVDINRIESRFDTRNVYSGKVMEKCGLKYEGTLRQADRNNFGICDSCYYGILREEYFKNIRKIK